MDGKQKTLGSSGQISFLQDVLPMKCFFYNKAVLTAKRPEIRFISKAGSPESGLFRALWARSCHAPSAPAIEAEKIGNGQQRTDSVGVLLDASIPRFGVPHINLDSFESELERRQLPPRMR